MHALAMKIHVHLYVKLVSTVGPLYSGHFGTRNDRTDYGGVLISGVKSYRQSLSSRECLYVIIVNYKYALWQRIDHLVLVTCVHNRGVCPQFRGLDYL